jgi:hypothetical protein
MVSSVAARQNTETERQTCTLLAKLCSERLVPVSAKPLGGDACQAAEAGAAAVPQVIRNKSGQPARAAHPLLYFATHLLLLFLAMRETVIAHVLAGGTFCDDTPFATTANKMGGDVECGFPGGGKLLRHSTWIAVVLHVVLHVNTLPLPRRRPPQLFSHERQK